MAAVELADRQKIQSCCKEAEPRSQAYGMEMKLHSRRGCFLKQSYQPFEDKRFAEAEVVLWHHDESGIQQSEYERRYGKHESGDWPGDSNFEKGSAIGNGGPDSNECAHGSGEPGNEIGQARIDAVVSTGQVVTHFVRHQDRHDGDAEG